jgi:hypothetical protein
MLLCGQPQPKAPCAHVIYAKLHENRTCVENNGMISLTVDSIENKNCMHWCQLQLNAFDEI